MTTTTRTTDLETTRSSTSWGLGARLSVSALIGFQLTAIVIGPLTFASSRGPGMTSPPLGAIMETMRPYVDAMFLNHGYFFFAPNPGASHLLRCRVETSDGATLSEVIPDRRRHWPRLLYHRHFMLSESLNSSYVPVQPPPEVRGDAARMEMWRAARRRYVAMHDSFARHLAERHGAERVELVRVEHRPPDPEEVYGRGISVSDPSLYRDLPDEFTKEERP